MKTISLIILAMLMMSCTEFKTMEMKFTDLTPSIIVMSASPVDSSGFSSVVITDAKNTRLIISSGFYLSTSLASVYGAGDTLPYFK